MPNRFLLIFANMTSEDGFVLYEESKLYFRKTGNGPQPLLLFHGFGQDHRAFDALTKNLDTKYTLYQFDLFFHGKSTWNQGEQPLEKSDWKNILKEFLAQNKIDKFAALGFSLGGKFALASMEIFPERVTELFLLAPDGIKTNFWYNLATYPYPLRSLFKSMIHHHQRFKTIASLAQKIGLIDKGVLRFVESQMDTLEKRKKVYLSWVVFRHLKFDLSKLIQLINSHKIETVLVAGKHDKVIRPENLFPLSKKINTLQFQILEAGHNDLIRKSQEVLMPFR